MPSRSQRATVLGALLRFISCGLLSLSLGILWRMTLAPQRINMATALLGIMILLSGFIAGGILWYIRDVRVRRKSGDESADENIVFSFVVFVGVPFAVMVLVTLVWLLSMVVGAA